MSLCHHAVRDAAVHWSEEDYQEDSILIITNDASHKVQPFEYSMMMTVNLHYFGNNFLLMESTVSRQGDSIEASVH